MKPVVKWGDNEYPLEITNMGLSEDGKHVLVKLRVSPEVLQQIKIGDKFDVVLEK